jgi:hypothetical protein
LELNDLLLLSVDPAGEDEEEQLPGLEDELHSDSVTNAGRGNDDFPVICRNRE